MQLLDLQTQRARLGGAVEEAIQRVIEHGRFIMGPEVGELEAALSDYCDARYCISCSSGTDALLLPLMAWQIGPGDAVFVPAFTFCATAEVVALLGATPVFTDVNAKTFCMDPDSLQEAIGLARENGLRPVAVIPVDLFGHPADYSAISVITEQENLRVLADAAQSFGATKDGQCVGVFGDVTATSFFPAKPLGCYGDGGAIFTDDEELRDLMLSIRIHGMGDQKYDNRRIGLNARLDTIQAAVLLQKLRIFDEEITARARIAHCYHTELEAVVTVPRESVGVTSAWAQYTIRVADRDRVKQALQDAGVPSMVYYAKPLNRQEAYLECPSVLAEDSVSDTLAESVLSLPVHPYLSADDQQRVIAAVRTATQQRKTG